MSKRSFYYLLVITILERFSFHGIRSLTLLLLIKELQFTDVAAFQLVAMLMSAIFILSLFGGWLADRFMGQQPMLLLGCCLSLIGYGLLFNPRASFGFSTIITSISLVFVGTSFFRPNLMALISNAATHMKFVQDSAYTIFYIVTNIGALAGIFGCAALGEQVGWAYAFRIAFMINILTLIMLYFSRHELRQLQLQHYTPKRRLKGFLLSLLLIFFVITMIKVAEYFYLKVLPFIFLALMLWLLMYSRREKTLGWRWYGSLVTIMLVNMVFFALYEQQNNSLLLFTERNIDRALTFSICSSTIQLIPTTLFQALDPLYNTVLGGAVAWLWYKLDHYQQNPSGLSKCSVGLIFLGLGFLTIVFFKPFATNGMMPMISIFLATFFIVLGELFTMPTTMSIFSQLTPPHLKSFGMGIWAFSLGFAEYIAFLFANLSSSMHAECPESPLQRLTIYCDCFFLYGALAVVCGIGLLLARPLLSKLIEKR